MADDVFCTGFFLFAGFDYRVYWHCFSGKARFSRQTYYTSAKMLRLLEIFLLKNSSLFSLKPLRLPAWSLSKSLPCVLLPPGLKPFFCYFKALMMSLLHLQRVAVFCIQTWTLSNFYGITTLQFIMKAKLSKQRFWHCHENGLMQTIQTIAHKLQVSVKSASLY